MRDILTSALQTLYNVARRQRVYWDYYRGEQPLLYVSESIRDYFRSRASEQLRFVENWASVVVASVLERIRLKGIEHTSATLSTNLERILEENALASLSNDVHEQALGSGECVVIVWPTVANARRVPRIYRQLPGSATMLYDPEDATRPVAAAKWWVDETSYVRLTLYTAEALFRYRSRSPLPQGTGLESSSTEAYLDPKTYAPFDRPDASAEEPNPIGLLPAVSFRPYSTALRPEFAKAAPVQDMLNKTLADMMVTGEWGAFPQRWAVTSADLSQLKSNPAGLWEIPAAPEGTEPTKLGQFDPADLANYVRVLEHFVAAIAAITRIPLHYLRAGGDTPSGEALRMMDSVLVHRAKARIASFTPAWKQVARLVLAFEGYTTDLVDFTVRFADPQIQFPERIADARAKNRQAGMPLAAILHEEGKSNDFIAQVEAELEAESRRTSVEAALAAALRGGEG